jgi:hypothetical protein
MHKLFNVLERHGIFVPNELLKVGILPAKKIEKLHHDLFNLDPIARRSDLLPIDTKQAPGIPRRNRSPQTLPQAAQPVF